MHEEEEKSVQGIVSRRKFLILTRVAILCVCVCVYTRFTHTQVFGGISARIFTHGDNRRPRHRAAASAIGCLCRGRCGWYVSVLLHCFLALAAHGFMRLCKVKGEAGYGNGFLGTCCPVYSRLLSRKFTLSV